MLYIFRRWRLYRRWLHTLDLWWCMMHLGQVCGAVKQTGVQLYYRLIP